LLKDKEFLQSLNRFILASQSPRRADLLKFIIKDFTIQVSESEEIIDPRLNSQQLVMELAKEKALEVSLNNKDAYVLGFDTLVILDGQPLGKPKDKKDAFNMLKSLSGRSHLVVTGCAIIKGDYVDKFSDEAVVTFNKVTDEEINEYLDTGEPFDKAGAYGIQGYGARYIKEIKGDYYSVMGMPLQKLYNKLRRL
jgi:septum formation protein